MRIGVIGGGVVGRATARAYLEHVEEVRVWDIVKERRTHSRNDVLECDLVFVCVPEDAVEDVIKDAPRDSHFVIRSTVPIGMTQYLQVKYRLSNVVHSPEFLTARCATADAQMPARNIIGEPRQEPEPHDLDCSELLHDLYSHRFPGVPILHMTSDESEAVKLFLNGFFAVKVAYFNEVRTLADKWHLNWDRVMEGILTDGRVAHAHTRVPGPDGLYGFGGACLPKDLITLVDQLFGAGVVPPPWITRAALERNRFDRERTSS